MDLYVLDKSFNMIGIIDSYTTLIWTREYYNVGTLELHTIADENSVRLLQKGNLLVKDTQLDEAMEIESIYLTQNNGETIVVRGRSIENFLNDRFIWNKQTYSGNVEVVIRNFVSSNSITPSKAGRVIPGLELGALAGITTTTIESYERYNLVEAVKELCLKHDIGWRIRFDRENRKYIFELYRGEDHSLEQTENPHKIFSTEYENIFNQEYTDDSSVYKTMAMVVGAEDSVTKVREIILINDNLTGFDRKELIVDAGDIRNTDDNNNPIPLSTYRQILTERGNTRLKESGIIRTFESDVSTLSNLKYRIDFDLGDKVTTVNEKWGIILNTRITSVEEIYENGALDIRLNFGSIIPTLNDVLKKVNK